MSPCKFKLKRAEARALPTVYPTKKGYSFNETALNEFSKTKRANRNGSPVFVNNFSGLHIRDDIVAELRAFDFRGAFHLAGEVVGDALAADRAIETLENQVRRFRPAHVA
jgi:hypothetical protein